MASAVQYEEIICYSYVKMPNECALQIKPCVLYSTNPAHCR